ncbi:MAG: TIGR01777 family oxidoreductase [Thermoanaerobaculia bacterium]|nr:TIGR01777 family oxidoreductase [Thermoanaerobaculia bacterium]
MSSFRHETTLPVSAEEAWAWHENQGAFGRLLPPWQKARVIHHPERLVDGTRLEFELVKGPFRLRWLAEHRNVRPGRGFDDVQVEGPFRSWRHRHELLPEGSGESRLRDRIEYQLPLPPLGGWLAGRAVRRDLERTFAYRQRVLRGDLALHSEHRQRPRQRIAVTGATGLVGRVLCDVLTTGGHRVVRLSRRPTEPDMVGWGPRRGVDSPAALEGIDAVVHLAGENIAAERWTERQMEKIRASRVEGTEWLIDSLERLERPPRTFLCASAIGIYGDRGDEVLTEASGPGEGFLADVGEAWETAATRAGELGARVVTARFGIVLSPRGGALGKMLPAFRLGLGGPFGNGRQGTSWVTIDDAVGALVHLLMESDAEGPFNVVAPGSVSNVELARTLGGVLRRPAAMPLPAPVARLAFGRMADEMLLASAWVRPERLVDAGFEFRFPELEGALRHLLGR